MSLSSITSNWRSLRESNQVLNDLDEWYTSTTLGKGLQGFMRGFAMYYLPVTLLKRKLKPEVLQRSLAVGTFAATVRIVNSLLSKPKGKELLQRILQSFSSFSNSQQELSCAIAGSTGIIAALQIDKTIGSALFVFWCLMRALPFILPSVPFGSTIVMCLSSAQIGTTWVKFPEDLNPSYRRFLISQGGKRASVLELIGENIPYRNICEYNHPGQSCLTHGLIYISKSFIRGIKLYAPLQLLFYILSSRRSVSYSLLGLVRSSAFMAFYCSFCWVVTCIGFSKYIVHPSKKLTPTALFSRLWLAGLAVLIEKPSRRPELAQYCATYALDTVYNHFVHRNIIKPNHQYIGTMVLCFSWFILLWNFREQPNILSKWLLGIVDKEKLESNSDNPQELSPQTL